MSVRHAGFLLILVLIFFLPAPTAHAQACADGCYQNLDDGFTGWDNLDPYGTGPYKPPTTQTCIAHSSQNQACRACMTQYDAQGQPTGNFICAFVTQYAACSCVNPGTPNCDSSRTTCSYKYD
jgi:hypothetical protein